MQHLPAPGDPGGPPAAEGRPSPGGHPPAHHRGGRKNRLRRTALYLPGTSGASCPRRRERSLLPGRIFGLPLGKGGAPHRVRRPEPEHTERGKGGLIGSNGAGKSTLMKLMVGLLKPNSGTVSLFGEAIGDKKAEDLSRRSPWYIKTRRRCSSRTPSAPTSLRHGGAERPGVKKRTAELLERFRLTELQDRDGRLMSGGRCAGPAWPSGSL